MNERDYNDGAKAKNLLSYHLVDHRYRSLNNVFVILCIIVPCAREKIQLYNFTINPHIKHGSTAKDKYSNR
jgi:hypothetical protein